MFDRLDRNHAVTVLHAPGLDDDALERFATEAQQLVAISESALVPVLELTRDGDDLLVATGMGVGGTLDARLAAEGLLAPEEAASVAALMLVAVQALHARGFVHRAIQPGNVFLGEDPGGLQLGGTSLVWLTDAEQTPRVSDRYRAPEIVAGRAAAPAADVYSVGAVLLEMLTGIVPSSAHPEPVQALLSGDFVSGLPVAVPMRLQNLLARMLNPNPLLRPSVAAGIAALNQLAVKPAHLINASSTPPGAAPATALTAGPVSDALRPVSADVNAESAPTRPRPGSMVVHALTGAWWLMPVAATALVIALVAALTHASSSQDKQLTSAPALRPVTAGQVQDVPGLPGAPSAFAPPRSGPGAQSSTAATSSSGPPPSTTPATSASTSTSPAAGAHPSNAGAPSPDAARSLTDAAITPVVSGSGSAGSQPSTSTDAPAVSPPPVTSATAAPTTPTPVVAPPTVTSTSLPSGSVGQPYSAQLAADGGSGALSWSVAGGSLPDGLSLASSGSVSGTPTASGGFSFSAQVTDSAGATDTVLVSVSIAAATVFAAADLNKDGVVDCQDLSILTGNITAPPTAGAGDLNGDGVVNAADQAIMVADLLPLSC